MGRIFETRKARCSPAGTGWRSSSRRIGKDIAIAVQGGRARPRDQPRAAPRHAERARGQHAEGQGRVGDQARLRARTPPTTRRSSTRATRRTASRCWSRPRPTTRRAPSRTCATHFNKGGGNLGTSGSVAFLFKRMGVFRLESGGHRRGGARARADRPRARGDGREHRREGRAAARPALRASPTSGSCRRRSRSARSRRSPPSPSTSPRRRSSCPRTRRPKCSSWSTRSSRTTTSRRSSTTSGSAGRAPSRAQPPSRGSKGSGAVGRWGSEARGRLEPRPRALQDRPRRRAQCPACAFAARNAFDCWPTMSTRLPIARLTSIRCRPQLASAPGRSCMTSPVMSSVRGSAGLPWTVTSRYEPLLVRHALRGEQAGHAHERRVDRRLRRHPGLRLRGRAGDAAAAGDEIRVQRAAAAAERRGIRARRRHVRRRATRPKREFAGGGMVERNDA